MTIIFIRFISLYFCVTLNSTYSGPFASIHAFRFSQLFWRKLQPLCIFLLSQIASLRTRMDHYLWRKGYPYEGSAHIPLLFRWPQSATLTHEAKRGEAAAGEVLVSFGAKGNTWKFLQDLSIYIIYIYIYVVSLTALYHMYRT